MNFGRNINPPRSLFDDQTENLGLSVNPRDPSRVKEILEIARRNLARAQASQTKYFNKTRRSWSPKINDIVYKREFHQSKAIEGFAAKLAPVFDGPYEVVSFISPSIVEIRKLSENSDGKQYRVHLKDLKQVHQEDYRRSD